MNEHLFNSKNNLIMKTVKNYTASELFTLANNIRKSEKCSQKEAFAKAKAQLENKNMFDFDDTAFKEEQFTRLMNQLNNGAVKFIYMNKKGQKIRTTGTLLASRIPTGKRVIQGRKTPREQGDVVFYDVRHGIYRTFNKANLIGIVLA